MTTGRDGILHRVSTTEMSTIWQWVLTRDQKPRNWAAWMYASSQENTQTRALSHVALCVKPAIYTEDDKESQAEGAKCPEAGWLALATQAVCGHAGALEQPSAPDEHVSTQTYRKNQATPPSTSRPPSSHSFTPRQANSRLNNKLLSAIP